MEQNEDVPVLTICYLHITTFLLNPLSSREIIGVGGGFLCENGGGFCMLLIFIFMEFYQQGC